PEDGRGKVSRHPSHQGPRFGSIPPVLPFLLPWPRLALPIRGILETRWDETTWPPAKAELRRALEMRRKLARSPGGTKGPADARRMKSDIGMLMSDLWGPRAEDDLQRSRRSTQRRRRDEGLHVDPQLGREAVGRRRDAGRRDRRAHVELPHRRPRSIGVYA